MQDATLSNAAFSFANTVNTFSYSAYSQANTVTTNTAVFSGASVLQPSAGSTLPATSISNFVVYINGQNIPSSYITLSESGGNVTLTFNTNAIGYTLVSTDEVIAVGKFQ